MQSYVVHVHDIEPLKKLRSYVHVSYFSTLHSETFFPSECSLFIESHFANQECYKGLLTRGKMVRKAEVKLHCKCRL